MELPGCKALPVFSEVEKKWRPRKSRSRAAGSFAGCTVSSLAERVSVVPGGSTDSSWALSRGKRLSPWPYCFMGGRAGSTEILDPIEAGAIDFGPFSSSHFLPGRRPLNGLLT